MSTWCCVKQCGACCYLEPSERPDLDVYLTTAQLEQYLSMVSDNGWCINFDPIERNCRIYADRPSFCRVEPGTFQEMFGVPPEELSDFAIDCCHEQIEDVYGDRSLEMIRFDQAIGL